MPRLTNGSPFTRLVVAAALGFAALVGQVPAARAAAPETVAVEGLLRSAAGAPAADGSYALTFALYPAASGGTALWYEGPLDVKIVGGVMSVALGTKTPIDAKVLATGALFLGVQVASDPELPRQPLRAVPFAIRSSVAEALDCVGCVPNSAVGFNYAASAQKGGAALDLTCTGCVGVAELTFDGDVDLAGNSLKAKNATFTGDVVAKSVTAGSFVGDGSKLTGIQTIAGSCAKGQAVVGVAVDGKLQCASLADALPGDGLDEVSSGLLTNQFSDTFAGDAGIAIPDNTGSSAFSKVVVSDLGTSQGLSVQVKLANSDLSTVAIKLLPPDDKKVGIVLCDPCGSKDAKSLDTSFPDKTTPKSGDFGTYVGKAIAGEWTLVVVDTGFCIKQAPGNATLCDLDAKTDGSIVSFGFTAKTLSSKKVGANGLLQLLNSDKEPQACTITVRGSIYFDTKIGALRYCDGKVWRTLSDTCGNGIVEPSEECDDGNNTSGDGCSASCLAAYGLIETKAGTSCQDILTTNTAAGEKIGDGVYWLDPEADGKGAFRVWCDQTVNGGGWTLAAKMDGGKSTFAYDSQLWTTDALLAEAQVSTAASEAKYQSFNSLPLKELRLVMAASGSTNATILSVPAGSLKAVFSGPYQATSLGRNGWKAMMSGASMQPYCNREGFNADCAGRNVRLGMVTNQENDCNSCDSYLGVGHTGQGGCDGQGSSWAGMMASCSPDNGVKNVPAFAWIWVR